MTVIFVTVYQNKLLRKTKCLTYPRFIAVCSVVILTTCSGISRQFIDNKRDNNIYDTTTLFMIRPVSTCINALILSYHIIVVFIHIELLFVRCALVGM